MTLEQLMKMFIYCLEESVIMIGSAWVIQDLQGQIKDKCHNWKLTLELYSWNIGEDIYQRKECISPKKKQEEALGRENNLCAITNEVDMDF